MNSFPSVQSQLQLDNTSNIHLCYPFDINIPQGGEEEQFVSGFTRQITSSLRHKESIVVEACAVGLPSSPFMFTQLLPTQYHMLIILQILTFVTNLHNY